MRENLIDSVMFVLDLGTALKIVPLHHQIYLTLKNELIGGEHPEDRPLPDEICLAKRFGVSRMTLRRALEALQRERLIVRKPGVGTFPLALDRSIKFHDSIEAFHEANAIRQRYRQQVLGSKVIDTPPFLRTPDWDFGEHTLRSTKLYRLGEAPVHFGIHYIPEALLRSLKRIRSTHGADLHAIAKLGINSARTDLAISAVAADIDAAQALQISAGTPVINTRRLSFDSSGQPIEYLHALSRPDTYEYTFRFGSNDPNGRGL